MKWVSRVHTCNAYLHIYCCIWPAAAIVLEWISTWYIFLVTLGGISGRKRTHRHIKTPSPSSAGLIMFTTAPLCHQIMATERLGQGEAFHIYEEPKYDILVAPQQPFTPQRYIHSQIIHLSLRLVGLLWVSACGGSQQASTALLWWGEKNACTNVKGLHSFREDLSQKHQEFVFIQRLSCWHLTCLLNVHVGFKA